MHTEQSIRRTIGVISKSRGSGLQKARRLLRLARQIGKLAREAKGSSVSAELTAKSLRLLREEARVAAWKALKGGPLRLGFGTRPEGDAYPRGWEDTQARLKHERGAQ